MSSRRINLLDVLLVLVVITVGSFFIVPLALFWFIAGFTAIMGIICLAMAWDEIVVWWSTRS